MHLTHIHTHTHITEFNYLLYNCCPLFSKLTGEVEEKVETSHAI